MNEASPHQFRTRNAPAKAQRTRSNSNEKTAKSTNLIDILLLITVWAQLRVPSDNDEINGETGLVWTAMNFRPKYAG
jgi:hypothetical protein